MLLSRKENSCDIRTLFVMPTLRQMSRRKLSSSLVLCEMDVFAMLNLILSAKEVLFTRTYRYIVAP